MLNVNGILIIRKRLLADYQYDSGYTFYYRHGPVALCLRGCD